MIEAGDEEVEEIDGASESIAPTFMLNNSKNTASELVWPKKLPPKSKKSFLKKVKKKNESFDIFFPRVEQEEEKH